MENMLVFIIIGALVTVLVLFYLFLMLFFPEWVGITGKKTQQELAEEAERRRQRNQEKN